MFLNSPVEKGGEWELIKGVTPNYTPPQVVAGVLTGETLEVNDRNLPHTITESQVEWSVSWPNIPYTFWDGTLIARLRAKLGTVNNAVLPLFHNAPADTILFMSFGMSTSYTWRNGRAGQSPVQLSMKFIEKSFTHAGGAVTHQHIYRPNYGYRRLMVNGEYLYSTSDLNAIWSP